MKKYLFFRIIRSIVSIFLVTTLTYAVIYTLVPRRTIFQQDPNISKLKSKPDDLENYKNDAYEKMGYIKFYTAKELVVEIQKTQPELTMDVNSTNTKIIKDWGKKNGWKVTQLAQSKNYYATKDVPLLTRVVKFYSTLIKVDHPWNVQDPKNPDLERSLKFKNDPEVGPSLVGSGTQYKYLIYFNSSFPFIHQNIIHFDLGSSYPTFAGLNVTDVIAGGQGKLASQEITMDDGSTMKSAIDPTSRQYKMTSALSDNDKKTYEDNYASTQNEYEDPSMIGTSFRMGFIAVIISYALGIPMAILMARFKSKWPDKIGTAIITVFIAVPSLAFIYFFRFLGSSWFGLPDSFPTLGAQDIKSWILPTIILGLLSVSGLAMWVRRYMIDQQSADYVKFAKAKGLSNGEISRRHIFKNAAIPITNGIPGSIIGAIGGATITETIFAAPGMGKMLPDAITSHNNPIVIGLVFIFTTVSVLSVLLGDITMSLVDPRIKLNSSKGDE